MSAEPAFYFDSSALTNIYVAEPESQLVERFLQSGGQGICSTLAQAEFASMLHRKVREGTPAVFAEEVWEAFQRDLRISALLPVETSAEDIRHSVFLLREYGTKHPLRTLDAIHLATARNFGVTRFLTFDARQRTVAALMGFELPVLK